MYSDELKKPEPKNHFSIGITDDVTFTSIPFEPEFGTESDDQVRAVFWGLGADGNQRKQKLDQDHRRGNSELRAGLLCLAILKPAR